MGQRFDRTTPRPITQTFRWAEGWSLALLLTLLPCLIAAQNESVHVVRVIDGDTIQVCCVAGKREKVRYIGINTPETTRRSTGL